jgi:hypothetical protein
LEEVGVLVLVREPVGETVDEKGPGSDVVEDTFELWVIIGM